MSNIRLGSDELRARLHVVGTVLMHGEECIFCLRHQGTRVGRVVPRTEYCTRTWCLALEQTDRSISEAHCIKSSPATCIDNSRLLPVSMTAANEILVRFRDSPRGS